MKQLIILLLGLLLLSGRARAHGGEDHGDAAKASTPAGATSFSVAALSEQFEVLLRYEPLEGGKPADLRLFLSDYATNVPIKGAKLTLTNPEDAGLKWAVTEKGPGEYLVEGEFPANKAYSFALNVVAGERADLLLLDGIKVGAKLPAAVAPAAATPSLFSSWKTILALVGAFLLGVGLTALLLRRRQRAGTSSTATPVVYENQA
ncbi:MULTISPECIES: hypothetical protein [Hymenobacter]|uniref:CopC domain-containing protein n=1 Tax=Hymenobacter psychrotolerans DSM 18569 TaxID=1121959 RepID=A0A1M7A0T3_9BACT|nr:MULTISPECIES: hypothetical protein [Hymenobacter]QNE42060.1 hypothetical protein F1C16_20750 [Hymenobacter sp. NBH84]SHL36270.1 hypothetical protein SAMN02746009_02627 [Hymenobacter psychrotolerans DSM 18569]